MESRLRAGTNQLCRATAEAYRKPTYSFRHSTKPCRTCVAFGPRKLGSQLVVVHLEGQDELEGLSELVYFVKCGSHIWNRDSEFIKVPIAPLVASIRRHALRNRIRPTEVRVLRLWKGIHRIRPRRA